MNITEFQKWVGDFYQERGWTGYGPFIRVGFLMEEAGELARAVRAIEIGRDRPDEGQKAAAEARQELVEELGDVLGNLILLANQYEVSFEEILDAHRAKLQKRYQAVETD
ncbi:MazG nucleotide pyrophosphohydrolase domain-containing protein [Brevibacillus porteri]|uniref:MazG nucleotide pyrophosphohydrolase domain-containing protein n=1 Tax=Brevibacillus porteri TaxID=2126350 RepID=UPI003709DC6D